MARRFYLVSYDVGDDRRRNRVAKALKDFGDRVQYSVFCCQLNARERIQMQEKLKTRMNDEEDQVLILDAGPVAGQQPQPEFDYLGRPYEIEPRSQIV